MEMVYHICVSHVLEESRWEQGRESHLLTPRSPGGCWDGDVAPHPPLPHPHSGRAVGWRHEPTSTHPTS